MSEARDRKELRHALKEPEHDRAGVGDQLGGDHAVVVGPLRAERNQAKTRQATPSRNAAMPCFTWWWSEPAS